MELDDHFMDNDHELSIIDGTLKSEQRILYEYRILNIFHWFVERFS